MKRILLSLLALSFFSSIQAQTSVFHEDFEVVDSVTSSGNPTWFQQAGLYTSATHCIRDTTLAISATLGDSAYLTTIPFSTVGNSSVLLYFNHICKISIENGGTIEVSNNNGTTWTKLTAAQRLTTTGNFSSGQFNSSSYGPTGTGWFPQPINDGVIPTQTWWKPETFDISALVGNAAQVKIRFKIKDNDGTGSHGCYGWLIDDINVRASFSELIPPRIVWAPPILQGTIWSLGPFNISDTITDASGVDTAYVFYTINSGAPASVGMTHISGNIWRGTIPPVSDSDTVCYYVRAIDASPSANVAVLPTTGCISFVAHTGIAFPYVDHFDTPNLYPPWTDSSTAGTRWQLGTPNFGATNSAFSSPNSWDINLNSAYGTNARAVLTSPPLDFTSLVNAKLSFWMNRNIGSGSGLRIEYTLNQGLSWQVLGTVNDPDALNGNWYNNTNINFSNIPGWDLNSNGWVKYGYRLTGPFNNAGPNIYLRFVFTSNFNTPADGVSIDDFSITPASPLDIGVSGINQPAGSAPSGSTASVNVSFKNYGTSTVSNSLISYKVNGTLIATEPWSGTLAPAATATFTFATTFTVPSGAYDICAYTTLTGDGDHSNDTLCGTKHGIPFFALPYFDNLDTGASVWVDSSSEPLTHWELGTPNFGVTTGAHSAPNAWDINLSSAYGANARSYLVSPLFNFSGVFNAKLSFWRRFNCESGFDGTQVQYSVDGGGTWNLIGTGPPDPNGSNWYNATISSSTPPTGPAFTGTAGGTWTKSTYKLGTVPGINNAATPVQFRFAFSSDFTVQTDGFSIDDIALTPPFALDVGAYSFLSPGSSSAVGAADTVKVIITNYGAQTVTGFNVNYSVNGGPSVAQLYSGSLAPAAFDTVTFTTTFSAPPGTFNICAFTSLTGDGDHTNDTICGSSRGVPLITLPYYDNFDTGTVVLWFDSSSDPGTHWELGTPNFAQTTGSYSQPNCWDVNLNTAYGNLARSYLISPLFDFTNIFNAKLSFYHNFNTESFWDGMRVDYSIDAGSTWNVLGVQWDPLGTRWYNKATINSSLLPAWDGMSFDSITSTVGWFKSTYKLVPLNNAGANVMLRFVFTSDGSVVVAGASVDNINIVPPSPLDASALAIVQPANFAPAGVSSPVRVVISNEGSSNITNFDVSYSINGVLSGTMTYAGTLQPSQQDTVTLPSFTFPPGNFNICAFTQLAGDGDHYNDTICKNSFGIVTVGIPYLDDFEGANNFFSPTPTQWQFGVPTSAIINTAYSPTTVWKTNLSGQYAGNNNDYLYTPFFDFSNAHVPELRFWHWYETQFGQFGDGGRIDISTDAGVTWHVLGSSTDTATSNWYTNPLLSSSGKPAWTGSSAGYLQSVYRLHQLENWQGGLVQFRFNFNSNGFTNNDGWAIDNFEIFSPYPNVAPVALSPIINPFYPTGVATQADSVQIKNRGSLLINAVDVNLSVDGNNIAADHVTFTPPLTPGSTRWHTYSSLWHPSPGGHLICAATSNPNGAVDVNPSDDQLCINGGIFDSTTATLTSSYCNDFEGGLPQLIPMNAYTYSLYTSDWQLGTPNKTIIHTTHSGSKAWITKLTGNYNSRDSSGLFTPVFAVDTSGCYELSFWHNFKTEAEQDGGTVDYSYDGGQSWTLLGHAYESNWYTSLYITGLFGPNPTAGWSGNSNGWRYAAHFVRFANSGHVIFRLRFGSDLTNQQEGWAIDDMCFKKVAHCEIGIDELTGNSIMLEQNFPNPAFDFTMITYSIPEHGKVKLTVTDVLGREVNVLENETQVAGIHHSELNVKNLADGMYYVALEFGKQKMVRKLVVAH